MKRLGIGIALAVVAMVAISVALANAPNSGQNAVVATTELVITEQQVAVSLNNVLAHPLDAVLANIVFAPEYQSPALTSWTCTFAINCVENTNPKGVRGDAILPNDVVVLGLNRQNFRALLVQEGVGDLILPISASVMVNCNIAHFPLGSTTHGGPLVGPELVLTAVQSAISFNTV